MNKRVFFLAIAAVIVSMAAFVSCKKDKDNLTSDATIEWRGAYEVDGCGFFVIINKKEYKPINETIIDDSYKSGQIDVTIKYELLNEKIEKSCGDIPYMLSFDGIRIISIKKKE
jgi:hypothetical protein